GVSEQTIHRCPPCRTRPIPSEILGPLFAVQDPPSQIDPQIPVVGGWRPGFPLEIAVDKLADAARKSQNWWFHSRQRPERDLLVQTGDGVLKNLRGAGRRSPQKVDVKIQYRINFLSRQAVAGAFPDSKLLEKGPGIRRQLHDAIGSRLHLNMARPDEQ